MRKRTLLVLLISVLVITGGLFYLENSYSLADTIFSQSLKGKPCALCSPEVIKKQIYLEGNTINALLNYKPLLEGHSLIVPKRHVERFENLTPDELVEIGSVISKVQQVFKKVYGKEDYVLFLQNGVAAGQTDPQVHFHMIPRGNEGLVVVKVKLLWAFLTEALFMRKPLPPDQLATKVDTLRDAMESVK